jgi:hypothetical protein
MRHVDTFHLTNLTLTESIEIVQHVPDRCDVVIAEKCTSYQSDNCDSAGRF